MITLHRIYQPYNRLPPRRVQVRTALHLETLSAVFNFPNLPTHLPIRILTKISTEEEKHFMLFLESKYKETYFICTKSKASLPHVCCGPSHIIPLDQSHHPIAVSAPRPR
jgi:hypothetical protein